jgi:hypothetical protein
LRGEQEPLVNLLGELMGIIVLPYLGPAAARREQERSAPASTGTGDHRRADRDPGEGDPLRGIPVRLTYRTARALEGVAEHPRASNRLIAEYAGVSDQGQISKLLARLERVGLLVNVGEGHSRGEPNAWMLTVKGEQVVHGMRVHTASHGSTRRTSAQQEAA